MRLKKSPSQARAQETVERIIAASTTVMLHHGVTGLTIRKVATEAGLGVGSIYDYFPDKQALLEAISEQRLKQRWELFEATLLTSEGTSLEDDLQTYRDAIKRTDLSSKLGPILRSASEQNAGLRKIVKKYEAKLTDGMSDFLKRHAPHLEDTQRNTLATYLMHIDYMTMALVTGASEAESALYTQMQTAIKAHLLQEAGVIAKGNDSKNSIL